MQIRHYCGSLCDDSTVLSKQNKCDKEKKILTLFNYYVLVCFRQYFHNNKLREECSIRKIQQRPPPPAPLTPAFRSGDPYAPQLYYTCVGVFFPECPISLHVQNKYICTSIWTNAPVCFSDIFPFLLRRSFKNCLPIVEAYIDSVNAVRSGETAP
jgi:hypothetical protein